MEHLAFGENGRYDLEMGKNRTGGSLLLLLFFFQGSWLASCSSSGPIRTLEFNRELPQDISSDLKTRFEVKETDVLESKPLRAKNRIPSGSLRQRVTKPSLEATESIPLKFPKRRPAMDPFSPGEKLVYSVSTFWSVASGEFVSESLPFKYIRGRKSYNFRVNGGITALLGLFKFGVVIESFTDYEGIFSHRVQFAVRKAGSQVKDPGQMDHVELFDSEKGEVYFWNHTEKGLNESRVPVVPFSQDPLSQVYYLRTIPLTTESPISIPVVMKGKNYEVIGQILRKESLDTIHGPKTCFVILFKRKHQDKVVEGESTWWISDDEYRIPYMMEATSKFGKFTLTLKSRDPK